MSQCTIEGCPNAAVAKGLCPQHYMRVRRTGSATTAPQKPGPKPKGKPQATDTASALAGLEAEISRLKAENAALRQPRPVYRPPPKQPQPQPPQAPRQAAASPDVAALEAKIATLTRERDEARSQGGPRDYLAEENPRLRRENERLKKELANAHAASGLDATAEGGIAKLTRENTALQKKLTEAEARLADDPGEIAKLLKRLKGAQTRIQNLNLQQAMNNAEPRRLDKLDWRTLQKVISPDSGGNATNEDRTKAAQIFNGLKLDIV
jgi:DNA repair exonuclease SbcCD ATPase subunit